MKNGRRGGRLPRTGGLERVTHAECECALVIAFSRRRQTAERVRSVRVVVEVHITEVELGALRERIHVADLLEVRTGAAAGCGRPDRWREARRRTIRSG